MTKKLENRLPIKIQWELTKYFQGLGFLETNEMRNSTLSTKRLKILAINYVDYDFTDRMKAVEFLRKIYKLLKSQKLITKFYEERKKKKSKRVGFYASKAWKDLRYRALKFYDRKCMCCGRNPEDHKIVLHVDHIKPRSLYPELCLKFSNVQILCEDCNLGKSNTDTIDYRPKIKLV